MQIVIVCVTSIQNLSFLIEHDCDEFVIRSEAVTAKIVTANEDYSIGQR